MFVEKYLEKTEPTFKILFVDVKIHVDEWSKSTEPFFDFNMIETKFYLEQLLGQYDNSISGWTGWKLSNE